ncbi:MAG: hypothetical protein U1F52_21920 [Burkholderiales bacterium]
MRAGPWGVLLAIAAVSLTGCAGERAKQVVECSGAPRDPSAAGPAFVGKEYGVRVAPIPLDSVLYASKATIKRVAVQGLFADRTEADTVRVTARLMNCTREPIHVTARTHFMDKTQRPTEKASAWQSVFVQPGSFTVYSETSLATDGIATYLVELREPDQ